MQPDSCERTAHRLRSAAGHLRAAAAMLEAGADGRTVIGHIVAVQCALQAARRVLTLQLVAEYFTSTRDAPGSQISAAELELLVDGLQRPLHPMTRKVGISR